MSASAVLLHASTAEEGASSDQPGLRVGRADFDQPIQVAQRCSGPMVPLLQHGPHEQHFRRRRLEVPPWRENALGAAHVARIGFVADAFGSQRSYAGYEVGKAK